MRYLYSQARLYIGAKRDTLVREATGDVIAQFDDDDYYAPDYLATMVRALDAADLVKLSGWFCIAATSNECFYWDTSVVLPIHFEIVPGEHARPFAMNPGSPSVADWRDRTLWGYGFSYAFRRELYSRAQFDPRIDRKQDYAFVEECRRAGARLACFADERGLALHVLHDSNTSKAFPNYRLPSFVLRQLFDEHVQEFLARSTITR